MPVTLICQECKKPYKRPASAARLSHFCSNACRARLTSQLLLKDLTGLHFGRWTVIQQASVAHGGETRWLCRCDCGNERIVYCSSLHRGSRSCGCFHKEVSAKQAARLFSKPIAPGKRFSRLTVIRENGRRGGQVAYLCKCDCGKYTTVVSTSLRSGNTKSCGCLSIDLLVGRTTTHGLTHHPMFSRWRHEMRRDADAEWTIDITALLFEIQPSCVICGSVKILSIDHVRPVSKGNGLRSGNAVVLCRSCNSRKHNLDLSRLPLDWQVKIERAALEFLRAWQSR